MSTLENVKNMVKEDILAKVSASGLKDFDLGHDLVIDKWNAALAGTDGEMCVAAGLNNCDTAHVLLGILNEEPEKVMEGIAIAAQVLDTDVKRIYLPEGKVTEAITAAADSFGVTVIEGIVNTRENAGGVIHHIETVAAIADVMAGNYQPGMYLAVAADGQMGSLQKVPFGTKVSEIDGVAAEGNKAFALARKVYPITSLDMELTEDLQPVDGVITLYSDKCCMIHEAEKVLLEERRQSCGKCLFCREGLIQLQTMTKEITEGQGKKEYLDLMSEIGEAMVFSTPCSMGQTASDITLTTLQHFASEYEDHILKKRCVNGVCKAFMSIYIDPAKCQGCEECAEACPENAIDGKAGYVHIIDEFECTKCGKCIAACQHGAVIQTDKRVPKLPDRPVKIGKGKKLRSADEEDTKKRDRRKKFKKAPVAAKAPAAAENSAETPKTESKKEIKIMKHLETDVIVVAGGPAGLAASVTAGENGLKSIIFEKSNTTGGAANMGMGPLGIGTKYQKNAFNDITVKEAFDLHMQYTHWRVDANLVETYFNKSADTIQWLEDMGVEFAGAFRYFKESAATWHIVKPENGVIGPRAAGPMVKALTNRAKELGAEIYLETPVTELIMEDGKCVGVIAVDKNGEGIEARAKAVVVATGGFGTNKEMIKQEFGYNLWEDYFPFNVPGTTGDGLNMMWNAGAVKYGQNIEMIYQLKDNMNYFLLDAVLRQPNLLINQEGDRFMNEGYMGNTTFTGNAIDLQPGHYAYCIMDYGILKYYKKNGPDIFDIVHPEEAFLAVDPEFDRAEADGYDGFFRADTIEELAEKLGIDPEKLEDTLDEYNEMCEEGFDSKFGKDHDFLHPITGKGGYLVGKFYIAAYGTVGGVKINKYCEVMDASGNPIPGLYSAGSDANSIYGDSYNFTLCGNTMGFAVNTGRMAGEAIADYIADLED